MTRRATTKAQRHVRAMSTDDLQVLRRELQQAVKDGARLLHAATAEVARRMLARNSR